MADLNRMGLSRSKGPVGFSYFASPTSSLLTGLVASWKLADLTDATGRGNTLTNNGGATFAPGKIGDAAFFASASTQFLSRANNTDLQFGDADWTLGFWFNTTTTGLDQGIVSKDGVGSGEREFVFRSLGSGFYRAVFFTATDTSQTIDNSVAVSDGVWNCAIVWHDTADQSINFSLNDGTTYSNVVGSAAQAASTAAFRIANDVFSGTYDGAVDDMNKWTRVLTAAERTTFYNGGTGIEYPF